MLFRTLVMLACSLCVVAQAQPAAASAPASHLADVADVAGTGPDAERAAVHAVLQQYLRVTDARDAAARGRALHPAALLASVTAGGALRLMTQDEWWERVARIPEGTPPRRSTVTLIDVAGLAAVARVDITDAQGRSSSDLFTLQKTQAGWRIVSKVLSVPL